jgi:hypothetical protein
MGIFGTVETVITWKLIKEIKNICLLHEEIE